MKIAILGWGSLIWKPGSLQKWLAGEFELGGPQLPIEFSRKSDDGRLTLVIDPIHGMEVPVRFASSRRKSILDAADDLRHRECSSLRNIGYADLSGTQASVRDYPNHKFASDLIRPWLETSGFDGIIWTALEPRFHRSFSVENAIAYLQDLQGTERRRAFEYIRRAPTEVETPLRRRLKELNLIDQ